MVTLRRMDSMMCWNNSHRINEQSSCSCDWFLGVHYSFIYPCFNSANIHCSRLRASVKDMLSLIMAPGWIGIQNSYPKKVCKCIWIYNQSHYVCAIRYSKNCLVTQPPCGTCVLGSLRLGLGLAVTSLEEAACIIWYSPSQLWISWSH